MSSNYLKKHPNIKYIDQNIYTNRKNINLEGKKSDYIKRRKYDKIIVVLRELRHCKIIKQKMNVILKGTIRKQN